MRYLSFAVVLSLAGSGLAAETGQPRLVVETGHHLSLVVSPRFSPDSRELYTASLDGTIRVWDTETGEALRVLRPPLTQLTAFTLSQDAKMLAAAGITGGRNVILLVDLEKDEFKTMEVPDGPPAVMHFSPDGRWLASRWVMHSLKVWDVARAKLHKDLGDSGMGIFTFSPDGRRLITTGDKAATLWAVPDGDSHKTMPTEQADYHHASWRDNDTVAVATSGGVFLWDLKADKATQLSPHTAQVVRYSPDRSKLLYSAEGTGVKSRLVLRDLKTGQEKEASPLPAYSNAFFSPDGRWLVVRGDYRNEDLAVLRADDLEMAYKLSLPYHRYSGIGWDPSGQAIWFGTRSAPVERFEGTMPLEAGFSLETWSYLPGKNFDFSKTSRARLSLGGQTLKNDDGVLQVVEDGKVVAERDKVARLTCATFLPGGRVVVGMGRSLVLFDPKRGDKGETVSTLGGHLGGLEAVALSKDERWLLTSGMDGTLRFWNVEQLKTLGQGETTQPVLSLFLKRGGNWIAWTPEGYYACSPDGERYIGWEVDNGPDRWKTFHPAAQFRNSLYRPELVKRVLQEGSLEKALWLVDKARQPVVIKDVLPPSVAITAPERRVVLITKGDPPDVTVTATADSPTHGVTALQLLMDERPFEGEKYLKTFPDPKTGLVTATWTIRAPGGKNRFSVVARTEKSYGVSQELVVNNLAPPPPPRLFVLLIGINKYTKLKPLDYAVNDAEELEQAFLRFNKGKPELFGDVFTKVLRDGEATPEAIRDQFAWLRDTATVDDVVVIFYAGHGDRDDAGRFYLLPADADPKNLCCTAVAATTLKERLKELRSRRVLLLLDACRSGAFGTDDLARDLKQADYGIVAICAAMGDEKSLESAELKHGYFTQKLLDGLSGVGGKTSTGEVTLTRLFGFIEEEVPKVTDDRQHPVMGRPTTLRTFSLAKP